MDAFEVIRQAAIRQSKATGRHVLRPKIPSMIVPAEQEMLHNIARDSYSGRGIIIDAGIFAGSSSETLTLALRERPDAEELSKRDPKPIQSYDLGVCDDFMAGLLNHHYQTGLVAGDSFLPILQENLSAFSDMLVFHAGDITAEKPTGPIEVMFLDVCKTAGINHYLMQTFLPEMVEGGTLIQQDFVHEWLPWVHLYMGLLADNFEHIGTYGSSTVYRLVKPITIDLSIDYYETLDVADISNLIDKSMEPLTEAQRYFVRFARGRTYIDKGKMAEARDTFERLSSEYPLHSQEIPYLPHPDIFKQYAAARGKAL